MLPVDIRMKVEVVAEAVRARLHHSERKERRGQEREGAGGSSRGEEEDGNCVSDSREMKWRVKRKTSW